MQGRQGGECVLPSNHSRTPLYIFVLCTFVCDVEMRMWWCVEERLKSIKRRRRPNFKEGRMESLFLSSKAGGGCTHVRGSRFFVVMVFVVAAVALGIAVVVVGIAVVIVVVALGIAVIAVVAAFGVAVIVIVAAFVIAVVEGGVGSTAREVVAAVAGVAALVQPVEIVVTAASGAAHATFIEAPVQRTGGLCVV